MREFFNKTIYPEEFPHFTNQTLIPYLEVAIVTVGGVEHSADLEALESDHNDPIVLELGLRHPESVKAAEGFVAILASQFRGSNVFVNLDGLVAVFPSSFV